MIVLLILWAGGCALTVSEYYRSVCSCEGFVIVETLVLVASIEVLVGSVCHETMCQASVCFQQESFMI